MTGVFSASTAAIARATDDAVHDRADRFGAFYTFPVGG